MTAVAIFVASLVLSLSWWGVGRSFGEGSGPAVAVMRGLTIFLLICAVAWFGRLPAFYVAPLIWGFVLTGLWQAWKKIPVQTLGWLGGGVALIALLFALPFVLNPQLLAYAHGGTDQWGYAAVSKWLTVHSVEELPAVGEKPGLDWVWRMLVFRDRPLLYVTLAAIAASSGFQSIVAYYVLPAALISALFLILFLGETDGNVRAKSARFAISLGVAVQPIVWLHFQYQVLGGVVAGLVLAILVLALCEHQAAAAKEDRLFFGVAVLLGVLLTGLYTVTIALAALGIVGSVFGFEVVRNAWLTKKLPTFPAAAAARWSAVGLVVVAACCFALSRRLTHEPLQPPRGSGAVSHSWAQIGAVFGLTKITPWYQSTEIRGPDGIDPVGYFPPGSQLGIALTFATLGVALVAATRRWRRGDVTLAVILATVILAIALAKSPRGDNIVLSRCLPIFGSLLLVVLGFAARFETNRWIRGTMLALACFPLVRAMPGIAKMLVHPENVISENQWKDPPRGDPWGTAAYLYFYRDSRPIDWSMAPDAYRQPLKPRTSEPAP